MASIIKAYYSSGTGSETASHQLLSHGNEEHTPRVTLEYLAEGAANVIFSLTTDPAVKGKLLRLRKGTWSGEEDVPPAKVQRPPPFLPTSQVLDFYRTNVYPLFECG